MTAARLALALALGVGCARTLPTPQGLTLAHAALECAQLGAARDQAPAQLARAEAGFAAARAACARDPGAGSCRDWAYVAQRRAEQAEAEANVALAHKSHQRAHLALAARRAQAQGLEASAAFPEATLPHDPRAAEVHRALGRLAPDARARHEPTRGVVVRLADARAFTPGTSRLLPRARRQLEQVARAMQDAPSGLLHVSGHAQPEDTHDLARARTHAVIAHLIASGVPATRVLPRVPPPGTHGAEPWPLLASPSLQAPKAPTQAGAPASGAAAASAAEVEIVWRGTTPR